MKAIVFALRGCPASWLGSYGNEWVVTPNLDRLAAEAIVFDNHISDCPDPEAAGRVWLGGRHGFPPLDESAAADVGSSPFTPKLLMRCQASGTHTVVVRANHPKTDAHPTYYAGWSEVFDARPKPEDASPLDALIASLPTLLSELEKRSRWLLWIEIDRLLPPWNVSQAVFDAYLNDPDDETEMTGMVDDDEEAPEDEADGSHDDPETTEAANTEEGEEETEDNGEDGDDASVEDATDEEPVVPMNDPPIGTFDTSDAARREWLHHSFAAVITSLDAELGRIFDELQIRGLDKSTAWILTSDYGLPLGDHGQVGRHRPWLHEELVHLPLIIRLPNAEESGRRVMAITQPTDLLPTILKLIGETLPEPLDGHSLLSLSRGQVEAIRHFACSGLELGGAKEFSIRTTEWAVLITVRGGADDPPRSGMLFKKPDDRWEVNNLRSHHVELAEQLEATLRDTVNAKQQSSG